MWLPGKSFYYNYFDSSTSFEPYYVMLYKSDDMTALIKMLYMQFQTASVSKLCIMSVFIKLQLQFHAIHTKSIWLSEFNLLFCIVVN